MNKLALIWIIFRTQEIKKINVQLHIVVYQGLHKDG